MSSLEAKALKLHRLLFCMRVYGAKNAFNMTFRAGRTTRTRTLVFSRCGHSSIRFNFRGRKDQGVLSHFFKTGIYIQDSPKFPITTIMDCGANIGDETTRFRIHHPNAEIIAVEADPDNFALLQKNTADDKKVTSVFGAVWSSNSELSLIKATNGNPESSSVANSTGGTRVKSYTIPSLMKMRNWDRIDILKLDIEGAEKQLFSSDTSWVDSVNCLIMEVPDSDSTGTLQLIFKKIRHLHWNGMACGECLILIRQDIDWKAERVIGIKQ